MTKQTFLDLEDTREALEARLQKIADGKDDDYTFGNLMELYNAEFIKPGITPGNKSQHHNVSPDHVIEKLITLKFPD